MTQSGGTYMEVPADDREREMTLVMGSSIR